MPEALFLGVDGGQSSTAAWIATEKGKVIGCGYGGPCNHAKAEAGRRKFLAAVGDCLQHACAQAGLDPQTLEFQAVCFGLSGGSEDKSEYIHQLIRSAQYKLTHDGEIALAGATEGKPGVIIIAGTGSFAFGKNAEGRVARSGGWGYIYGDEGGAFDLTRRALRAALRYEEGWGPKTILRERLLSASRLGSANELLHDFYADVPRTAVASYAALVTSSAEEGDAVAIGIVEEAADELCRYAGGVRHQLFRSDDSPPVSYIGGVFRSPLFRERFTSKAATLSGNVGPPLQSPVAGALLEALKLGGRADVSLSGSLVHGGTAS